MTARQHERRAIAWAVLATLGLFCARTAGENGLFPAWATLLVLTAVLLASARAAVHYHHAYQGEPT